MRTIIPSLTRSSQALKALQAAPTSQMPAVTPSSCNGPRNGGRPMRNTGGTVRTTSQSTLGRVSS